MRYDHQGMSEVFGKWDLASHAQVITKLTLNERKFLGGIGKSSRVESNFEGAGLAFVMTRLGKVVDTLLAGDIVKM